MRGERDRGIVGKCRDCGTVTATYASDGASAAPGNAVCRSCGGPLDAIEGAKPGSSNASRLVDGVPLAGVLLSALVEADGGMSQDELVSTLGRSPTLVRRTIRQLEDEGEIVRETRSGEWYVRIAPSQTEVSAGVSSPRRE